MPRPRAISGHREIGGKRIFFRSRWEANYARYLEYLKAQKLIREWVHEPRTFWFDGIKRGCVSYLPDFRQDNVDGTCEWIEVKGWMDPRSRTKIKRFRKYFPGERLTVIDGGWFKANGKNFALIIDGWE